MVTAGLLLLVTGFLLWWWPVLALGPIALLGLLARISLADRATDIGRRAEQGRIATVFAEIAATIEGHAHDLDGALALQGELLELERDWASADIEADEILVRARSLRLRASAKERIEDVTSAETLGRLRRLQRRLGLRDRARLDASDPLNHHCTNLAGGLVAGSGLRGSHLGGS